MEFLHVTFQNYLNQFWDIESNSMISKHNFFSSTTSSVIWYIILNWVFMLLISITNLIYHRFHSEFFSIQNFSPYELVWYPVCNNFIRFYIAFSSDFKWQTFLHFYNTFYPVWFSTWFSPLDCKPLDGLFSLDFPVPFRSRCSDSQLYVSTWQGYGAQLFYETLVSVKVCG